MGDGYARVRGGVGGTSLYRPLNFVVNQKPSLKVKFFLYKIGGKKGMKVDLGMALKQISRMNESDVP